MNIILRENCAKLSRCWKDRLISGRCWFNLYYRFWKNSKNKILPYSNSWKNNFSMNFLWRENKYTS